jgi:hypothetical protein
MNSTTNIIQEDISDIIGLNTLPEEEQILMMRNIGDIVLESALLRLTADLTDEQALALSQYMENVADQNILLNHIIENYKNFTSILQEEISAFKEEAIAIMGPKV